MTNIQKQCLLTYLGYDPGGVDGIWGPKSRAATVAFQASQGLPADGAFSPETEEAILAALCRDRPDRDWWEEIRFFTRGEFACKCGRFCDGYPGEMDRTLVKTADRLRAHFGAPVTVSSGLRCPQHNANVGGVRNSRHLCGKAMDFSVAGKTAAAVLEFVQRQPEIRYAYAIDDRFVHMDVD